MCISGFGFLTLVSGFLHCGSMAGSGIWILVGNFAKWQRLSVNVIASATARWWPLMDCECSRKMAGVGIWGEKFEFWEATDVDYRMANSCLRDVWGWISGFGLLTVGLDWRSTCLGEQPRDRVWGVYRQHGLSTCFSGKFEFLLRVLDSQRISRALAYQDIGTW